MGGQLQWLGLSILDPIHCNILPEANPAVKSGVHLLPWPISCLFPSPFFCPCLCAWSVCFLVSYSQALIYPSEINSKQYWIHALDSCFPSGWIHPHPLTHSFTIWFLWEPNLVIEQVGNVPRRKAPVKEKVESDRSDPLPISTCQPHLQCSAVKTLHRRSALC